MTSGGNPPFDPYYTWLGIPPSEQPPNLYRLLGLRNFENNVRAIENAADRLMLQVRSFQSGPNAVAAQRLLNEITTARLTLCEETKKVRYDQQLATQLQPAPASRPIPVAAPLPPHATPLPLHATSPHITPAQPIPLPIPIQQPAAVIVAPQASPGLVIDTHDAPGSSVARSSVRRRPADGGSMVMTVIKTVVGGAGGLALGLVIVWVGWRADPFGLFGEQPKGAVANKSKSAQQNAVAQDAGPSENPVTQSAVTQRPNPAVSSANTAAGPSNQSVSPQNQPAISSGASANTSTGNRTPPEGSQQPISTGTVPISPPRVTVSSVQPNTPTANDNQDKPPLNNSAPFGGEPTSNPPGPTNQIQAAQREEPPSPEAQKEKLAQLKEIYKQEFDSSLKPANREPFIEFLLSTAGKVKSDPDAQFVLYREAYDRAVALKDFGLAAKVVDSIEETFEVEPFRLRTHLLTQASPAARQPADRLIVARSALELANAAVSQKKLDDAKRLANIAEVHVKLIPDAQFRTQSLAELTEIERAVAQASPVERALKVLEQDPHSAEANLTVGKYYCLIAGDWQKGLPLLAKTSDERLSAAAKTDLEAASQGQANVALGDQWFDLAKSDEELKGCYHRAEYWYRQALDSTSGLERIKIEQRLEQIAALSLAKPTGNIASTSPLRKFSQMFGDSESFDPVNVFTHLNPALLRGNGPWSGSGDTLLSNSRASRAWLQSTYTPPREYQVTLKVRRSDTPSAGDPGFIIGLSTPRQQFVVAIDAVVAGGYATAISLPPGKAGKTNPTLVTYPQRKLNDTFRFDPTTRSYSYGSTIVCEVGARRIRVLIDGEEATRYEGDFGQLVVPREWSVPDPKGLFIGSHLARYEISRWTVEPIGDTR